MAPNLRFPEFNGEWKERRFNEIYSFKSTNSYSREKLNYEHGEVLNIHYGDIHTKFDSLFDINKEYVPFINKEINTSKINNDNFLKNGDLVIVDASEDYNDIGKTIEVCNLNGEKIVAGLHTLLARRESKDMANSFASFLMKTHRVRLEVMKIAQGIKVLGISKNRLDKIPLVIPSIIEQTKIANLLIAVDRRIQTQNKIIENLESLIKGMTHKIFSQKLRFKDYDGSDFPNWNEKKLGEITKYYDGTHQTPKYVDSGIPFYSVEHVTANQFSKTKFISQDVFEKENKRVKLEKGDVLMTKIGSIGVAKYIDWNVNASFYVSLALIKSNCNFNSQFLSFAINHHAFQKELWRRTIHVAFPQKINLGDIGECKIQLPSIQEQTKIANFLSSFAQKLEKEKQILVQYQQQKKYLLQNLFV